MSFEQTRRLLSTTSARLSALNALLLIASFVLTGALTWWVSMSSAERALRDRIALELRSLRAEAHLEGIKPVAEAIRTRAEQPGSLVYWFADRAGNLLAGDLPAMNLADGWHILKLRPEAVGAEQHDELVILSATLPDGARLAIGGDLGQGERVRDTILSAMSWIGTLTLAAGIAAGVIATRRVLARINGLNTVITRVTEGDLSARALVDAPSSSGDVELLARGINDMLDRIATLVSSVRRISSDVAHELRTPLSHLRLKLEDARAASSVAEARASIETAQARTDELLRTFDAILRLAEIEAGAGRARFAPVAIGPLVELVVDAYRPDIEMSGHRLEIGRLDDATLRGDRDLIAQALANLLENAMRHTPIGTAISVQTIANGDFLHLVVADNGPGVPAAARESLVIPFLRLDSSRTQPGAGLGLSIVAAIAQMHGALLSVRDAEPGLAIDLKFDRH